jgi:hypothetical protein
MSSGMSSIYLEKYSEKSIAVFGDTQPVKEKLKELGGKFNSNLRGKAGWIFPLKCEESVKAFVSSNKNSSDNIEEDNFSDTCEPSEDEKPKRLLKPTKMITLEAIMEKLEKLEKAQLQILALLNQEE